MEKVGFLPKKLVNMLELLRRKSKNKVVPGPALHSNSNF